MTMPALAIGLAHTRACKGAPSSRPHPDPPAGSMTRLLAFVLLLALGLAGAMRGVTAQPAGSSAKVVHVAPIDGVVDLGLPHFVQRVLKDAAAAGAAAVVLEINTFGGRVDGAVQVRDALLDSPVRTIAFVNKRAISAGALIALATETIAMAGGGTIGAATPVQGGGDSGGMQAVGEKAVSYIRSEFRATAERRKRNPALAEAMVDADIEIAGVVAKGKLLTLTTDEAMALKLADIKADTLESALAQAGLAGARIVRATPNWSEHLVRFLTHPIVSSLLITVATLGIILEMRTVGFGIAGALGLSSLALFFWSHWLVQLAGWEELLLVLAGFTLLALEVFLIPGFGVAGILGLVALVAAFVLSLIGAGATLETVVDALGRVIVSILVAIAAGVAILRVLPRTAYGRRLILETGLQRGEGFDAPPESRQRLVGKTGHAVSSLQLVGVADIDDERLEVVSDDEMIEPGAAIRVVRVDGRRVIVRRAASAGHESNTTRSDP